MTNPPPFSLIDIFFSLQNVVAIFVRPFVIHNSTQASIDERHVCRCQSAYSLVGTQRVAKFHESAENEVNVYMGLFRLPQHRADVVVTFNDPHFIRYNHILLTFFFRMLTLMLQVALPQ